MTGNRREDDRQKEEKMTGKRGGQDIERWGNNFFTAKT
jgi:hypothetical protein